MHQHINNYTRKVTQALAHNAMFQVQELGESLCQAWAKGHSTYLCGNGGSAGNAIHLANDFLYGVGVKNGGGMRVEALSANPAVITCLANDIGYENIYAEQLRVKAHQGDVLIVLSGSVGSQPYNEFKPKKRYVRGGDVLQLITPDATAYVGVTLRQIQG